ncbi:MAG TPA: sigma 54-interacting transcriptional regulator, partial [Terriglobia bacterium]|nr:sigma 54-interacting transcriptional regulator [Terriglobia bacterium]
AVGAMVFFSREVREPDQDVLQMLANVGSQIGQFIERRRAEQELLRSEAYLAEAQRLSLTGSFGWNVSSGELFWSKETFCILGYDQEMKPTLELVLKRVHPEDVALVQEIFDRASRDRTDVDFEHRLVLPDGSVKHVHVVAHATKDGSGGLEFVGAVSDVTLGKTAQEKIRQTEKEFRQIVDLIPQFIAVLAPDGSALYVNQTLLEYTGLPREVFHTIDFRKHVFHPDDVQRLRDERQKALRSGVPFQLEQRARGKDGQYRWFLIQYNPLKNEQGNILRWYATGTNIEDRKRAEQRMLDENMALREEIDRTSMYEEIVGSSRPLRTVISQISKVAPTDSTVMIFGETGTGKELIAAAIHKRSKRATKAFIRVNCAAIPPSLIASELFGHEKGAFTGAFQRRAGRFESADGGTIFLDEIGELSLETQATLLRVLQEHEIERVGSNRQISVDVRVLAATNRDLEAAVAAGTFREDLFYRLNVFPIRVPALRERKDDIPMLVKYLVERHAKSTGRKINHITKQTLDLFQTYNWPGNIRELQNVVERAVILCDGDTFSVDESWLRRKPSPLSRRSVPRPGALAEDKKEFSQRERTAIEAALAECEGRVSGPRGAAAILGIPHQTLESKIATLGIDKRKFKVRSAGGPA